MQLYNLEPLDRTRTPTSLSSFRISDPFAHTKLALLKVSSC